MDFNNDKSLHHVSPALNGMSAGDAINPAAPTPAPTIDFLPYNVLCLDQLPKVRETAQSHASAFASCPPAERAALLESMRLRLEASLQSIYQQPTVVVNTITTAHIAALTQLIEPEDRVFIDQNVSASLRSASFQIDARGIRVEVIRHNQLSKLRKVLEQSAGSRCWYITEGVYYNSGDQMDVDDIKDLLQQYSNLHLYADDTHGSSWACRQGIGELKQRLGAHPRVTTSLVLSTGYSDDFCSAVICPDAATKRKIEAASARLSTRLPLKPAQLGAGLAAAAFHASEELAPLQGKLESLIVDFRTLALALDLPLLDASATPIFYFGLANVELSVLLNQALTEAGFLVEVSCYPHVASKASGLRCAVNTNHSRADIVTFLETFKAHKIRLQHLLRLSNEQIRDAFAL